MIIKEICSGTPRCWDWHFWYIPILSSIPKAAFPDFCNLVHANNSQLFTRLVWLKGHQMSEGWHSRTLFLTQTSLPTEAPFLIPSSFTLGAVWFKITTAIRRCVKLFRIYSWRAQLCWTAQPQLGGGTALWHLAEAKVTARGERWEQGSFLPSVDMERGAESCLWNPARPCHL